MTYEPTSFKKIAIDYVKDKIPDNVFILMGSTDIAEETKQSLDGNVIDNIARKGHLLTMDIDQFAVCEDGQIILLDDCGNIAYCDMKRFSVEIEKELKGEKE